MYNKYLKIEIWSIGIVKKPVSDLIFNDEGMNADPEVVWFSEPGKREYLADPCGVISGDTKLIFAEWFNYNEMKGKIAKITLPGTLEKSSINSANKNIQTVVFENNIYNEYHHSYPHFINSDHCMTESWQSGKITLFYPNEDFTILRERALLVDEIEAVDPTLCFHEGRWWIFCTSRSNSNTHLYLFYSEQLNEKFKPHKLNPVKIDIRSTRPAGSLIARDNLLYRPAQDCSVTYGGRIAINRIRCLTPLCFEEETIRFINPVSNCRYNQGIHTVSPLGNYSIIDGKYFKLDLSFGIIQLKKKFN